MTILKSILPEEWVLHSYKPDYGIDIVVEIFKYVDNARQISETLGELFYAQIKSKKTTKFEKIKVFSRLNVEKFKLTEEIKTFVEIDVIKIKMETSELLTIQSMGAGLPVLLLLVALDLKRIFFICLNDLIEKVIIPKDPNYKKKKYITILIPKKNEITTNKTSLSPLSFYAKRIKLYSAFTKFQYQYNELAHLNFIFERSEVLRLVRHFISIIKQFDFWKDCQMWQLIPEMYIEIEKLDDKITELESDPSFFDIENNQNEIDELGFKIFTTFRNLVNISNMYEELCREWNLPTYLAQFLSYPDLLSEFH